MKEYIIWLENSSCMTGRVDADVAAHMLVEYRRRHRKHDYSFRDSDGLVIVNMKKVTAIAFNNITDRNKTGF
jgi:hypothetical protein